MKIGLRIDVDTFRGTRQGVPNLCRLLADHQIKASFFFSVGPDNMGRNLWRLIHPGFFYKMVRSNASKLYGWDILLRGTLWPGPLIGDRLSHIIRSARDAGHEIGFHAWDHQQWQAKMDKMDSKTIYHSIGRGVSLLSQILGRPPSCSAVPGWKCSDRVLLEKAKFPFDYNSDCRGEEIFYPLVRGKGLSQPQIPVTLPTYDEVIGHNGVTEHRYNDYIFSLLKPKGLNVLTVHAEVEGIAHLELFKRFLDKASAEDVLFIPLGRLLADSREFGHAAIISKEIPGRQGWVSCQETSES